MIALKRTNIGIVLILSLVFLVTSTAAASRSLAQIKQSLKARNGAVQQLKAAGVVGETNRGYLAFIGASKGKDALVASENKDRKELYAIVAQQQGTSVAKVEQNMGVVKAKRAKPGEYYQDASGAWKKK